jgi:hypothetical protein
MKRKNQDDAFNPLSFNVGLARQVLDRKPNRTPARPPAREPIPAPAEHGTAAPAAMKIAPLDPKPKKKPKPAPMNEQGGGVGNTFRGGVRQDLRVPLDEDRRDELADLVRLMNRGLRSRLPEAITFRALLTVMLSCEEEILTAAKASPIGRTPARQDTVAATHAERDVALVLAKAMTRANPRELADRYARLLAELTTEQGGDLERAA